MRLGRSGIGLALVLGMVAPTPIARAQVTAAQDGIATNVTTSGGGGSQNYEITDGTQKGGNLFHSFQQFDLGRGDVANFVTNPAIANVFGRVGGGNASFIDGQLRVTGSNANLYLMNPAGIVFGANATLDLPASFLATTASGLQFPQDTWTLTSDNVSRLNGDLEALSFDFSLPGTLVQAGTLGVNGGQTLTLAGGTLVNTGVLTGENLALATLSPGQRLLLNVPGQLLRLDIQMSTTSPQSAPFTILALPQLLTGQNPGNNLATDLRVSNQGAGDPVVTWQGDGQAILSAPGDLVIRGNLGISQANDGGGLWVRSAHDLDALASEIAARSYWGTGGTVDLQARDRLFAGQIATPSTYGRGGTITLRSGGDLGLGGDLDASSAYDQGGNIHLTSGANLYSRWALVQTNGGTVSLTAGWNLDAGMILSRDLWGQGGAMILDSRGGALKLWGKLDSSGAWGGGPIALHSFGEMDTYEAGMISSQSINGQGGAVDITAGSDLLLTAINSASTGDRGGNLTLHSGGTMLLTADLDSSGWTNGGDIQLTSGGDLDGHWARLFAWGDLENGGRIQINSQGRLILGNLDSQNRDPYFTSQGRGGDIILEGRGDVLVSDYVLSRGGGGGGMVQITSHRGKIASQNSASAIISTAYGNQGSGGDVTVTAPGDILNLWVSTYSTGEQPGDRSGNITLTSTGGQVNSQFDTYPQPRLTPNTDLGDPAIAATFYDTVRTIGNGGSHLSAFAPYGQGGNVAIRAIGGITVGNISSYGGTGSGSVTLETAGGTLNSGVIFSATDTGRSQSVQVINRLGPLNLQPIATYANHGYGGDVTLQANGGITVFNVNSYGDLGSGDVRLLLNQGNLIAQNILTIAPNGTSGNIVINNVATQGNLYTANLLSQGGITAGGIVLQAPGGTIRTGNIASLAGSGIAGNIVVMALQNITTGNITSSGGGGNGNISLGSDQGNIQTGALRGNRVQLRDTMTSRVTSALVNARGDRQVNSSLQAVELKTREEFNTYFGEKLPYRNVNPQSIRQTLAEIEQQTGERSAQIYLYFGDQTGITSSLKAILFTPKGDPIVLKLPGITKEKLDQTIKDFREKLILSVRRSSDDRAYLQDAQALYQWLIAPLDPYLRENNIQNLLFSLDTGLRSLPLAALYDGQKFLIETYSVGMVPSFGLMQSGYRSLANAQVLAMGATQFQALPPLPAVSSEISGITQLWQGQEFLNEAFTKNNLLTSQAENPRPIIHLATHADFRPGDPQASAIYLWQDRLSLQDLSSLKLKESQVELLVLSACKTAVGDPQSELGFAGLAVASGAKTALASLWSVSDEGTLALMTTFYHELRSAKVKAEALRKAQLAMLRGEVQVRDGQLRGTGLGLNLPLPPELAKINRRDLANPYYWSGFTLVGSPW